MPAFLKSVLAVVAGLAASVVTVVVLTWLAVLLFFGGDMSAEPTPLYLALNVAYSFGAAVLGGWVAARLAPRRGLAHAVAAAVAILLLSFGGSGAEAEGASGVPSWYGTVLSVLAPTGVLLGGWLRVRSPRAEP